MTGLKIVDDLRAAAIGTGDMRSPQGEFGLLVDAADLLERMHRMLTSIAPDKVPGPFICGAGPEGENGLSDSYSICPAYGADVGATGRFVRIDSLGRDQGAVQILKERQRQFEREGWTAEHDDGNQNREMLKAAICYINGNMKDWPEEWDRKWYKPETTERNLAKAGALVAAEISRRHRKTIKIQSVKEEDIEFTLKLGTWRMRNGEECELHGKSGEVTEKYPWFGAIPSQPGLDGWNLEGKSKFDPAYDLETFVSELKK